MKKTTKILLFFTLIICLCALLCACDKDDGNVSGGAVITDSTDNSSSSMTSMMTLPETEPTTASGDSMTSFIGEQSSAVSKEVLQQDIETKITVDDAKEIALQKAGLENAVFVKTQLDKGDTIYSWTIVFVNDNKMYEYKIDANTGEVTDYSVEEVE